MPNLNPNVNLVGASVLFFEGVAVALAYGLELIKPIPALGAGVTALVLNDLAGDLGSGNALVTVTPRLESNDPTIDPLDNVFTYSLQGVPGPDMLPYGITTDKYVMLVRMFKVTPTGPVQAECPFMMTITQQSLGEYGTVPPEVPGG